MIVRPANSPHQGMRAADSMVFMEAIFALCGFTRRYSIIFRQKLAKMNVLPFNVDLTHPSPVSLTPRYAAHTTSVRAVDPDVSRVALRVDFAEIVERVVQAIAVYMIDLLRPSSIGHAPDDPVCQKAATEHRSHPVSLRLGCRERFLASPFLIPTDQIWPAQIFLGARLPKEATGLRVIFKQLTKGSRVGQLGCSHIVSPHAVVRAGRRSNVVSGPFQLSQKLTPGNFFRQFDANRSGVGFDLTGDDDKGTTVTTTTEVKGQGQ